MKRPSLVYVTCLASVLELVACAKPRERPHADEHLVAALELVSSNPEAALSELGLAEHIEPAQRAYVRGLAYEGQKKFDEAERAFLEATQADPEGLKPRTALGRVQILLGKTEEALKNIRHVVLKDPGELPAILLLVVCERGGSERTEARRALLTWPETRPLSKNPVPLRAEYYLALASVSDDVTGQDAASKNAESSDIGSVSAALNLARFAHLQEKHALSRGLARKLAGAEATADELESIAEFALLVGDSTATDRALRRIPGNVRSAPLLLLRGRHELAVGHFKRALGHFVAAQSLVKKDDLKLRDQVEYWVAAALRADGDLAQAREVLSALLKRSPEHRASQFLMSELELDAGEYEQAKSRLAQLVNKYPQDRDLLLRLGDAQMQSRDFVAAESTYRKTLSSGTYEHTISLRIADALRRQEKRSDALDYLKQEWGKHSEEIALLRAIVSELVYQKKVDDALQVLGAASLKTSDKVGVELLLADTYDSLGRPSDVLSVLTKLTKAEPKSARAWSALARMQQRKGDEEGMEASLRTVLKLNPEAHKDKARLATLLNKRSNTKEAAQLFAELADASRRDLVALNNAAMLYADELNDPGKAVEYAEQAYELASEQPAVMDTLGWALVRRGNKADLERALTLLKRANSMRVSAESTYHYGIALMKSGKEAEGKTLIQRALAVPGDEDWRKAARAAAHL